jgi:hypothetical protein
MLPVKDSFWKEVPVKDGSLTKKLPLKESSSEGYFL